MSESAVATLSPAVPTAEDTDPANTSAPNELFSPIPDPQSPSPPPPADLSPRLDETIAEVAANCSPKSETNALIIDETEANPIGDESDEPPPQLELAEIKEEKEKPKEEAKPTKPEEQPEDLSLKVEKKEEPKVAAKNQLALAMQSLKNWTKFPNAMTAIAATKPPTLKAVTPPVSTNPPESAASVIPASSAPTPVPASTSATAATTPPEPKKKAPPKPKKPVVAKKENVPVTTQPHILMYYPTHAMMGNNQFVYGMPMMRPTLQGPRGPTPIFVQQSSAALTSTVAATTTTAAASANSGKASSSRKSNGSNGKSKEPVSTIQTAANPVHIEGMNLFPVTLSSKTIVQPMTTGPTVQQYLNTIKPAPTTVTPSTSRPQPPQYFVQSSAAGGVGPARLIGVRPQRPIAFDQSFMIRPNGNLIFAQPNSAYIQNDCPPPPTLSPNPSIQSSSSSKSPRPSTTSKRKSDAPSLTAFNANPDDDEPPKIEKEGRDFEMNSSDIRQRAQQSFVSDAARAHRQQQKAGHSRTVVHRIDGYAIEETIGSANKPTKSPKKPTTAAEEFRAISRKSLNGIPFNIVPASSICATSTVSSSGNSNSQSGAAKSRPLSGAAARSAAAKSARSNGALRTRGSERDAPEVVKSVNKILLESKVGNSPTKSAADSTSRKRVSTRRGPDHSRGSSAEPLSKKERMEAEELPNVSKRRNRELQELLAMDFGKGKSPFHTTSVTEYSKEILTSRQRLQAASTTPTGPLDESGRDSRLSINSKSRRSQRQSSATSSVDVPRGRPRRSQQRVRRFYEGGSDVDDDEEEEEEEELDDEEEAPAAKIKREDRSQCCYECGKPRFNSKGPLYPKSPQYCSAHCKEAFRKKTRLEQTLSAKFPGNIDSPSDSRAGSRLNNSKLSTHSSPANASNNRSAMNSPAAALANGSQRLSTASFSSLPVNGHNGSGSSVSGANASTSNPDLEDLRAMGVANWNPQEVARWATIVTGSEQVGEKFAEQDVDGDALLILNQQNLRDELGIKLGPAVKIINELKLMQERL